MRFSFIAKESIHFPAGKSANILRGAFGTIFRRIACLPSCRGTAECEQRAVCPYARLFEPKAVDGPSGFADLPRPFVFRAMHLDGRTIAAGQSFYFDLHLFDHEPTNIAYFVLAFAQLAREGLGPGRRKVELTSVARLNEMAEPEGLIYQEGMVRAEAGAGAVVIDLRPGETPILRVRVRFVTPTELKSGQQIVTRPEFGVLACRARDRISQLRELYGEGALELDFRGFGERAAQVKMTNSAMRMVDVERRSSRTGQVHSMGGFVGEAEYEGELGEFVPYLRAARWTGVGRQTVWGNGEIAVVFSRR